MKILVKGDMKGKQPNSSTNKDKKTKKALKDEEEKNHVTQRDKGERSRK